MKLLLTLTLMLAIASASYGQGTVQLNNRIPPSVVARFCDPKTGGGLGAGYTAQLFLVSMDSRMVLPMFPSTTFRTSSAAAMGYVNPVEVTVPGVPPGTKATFVLRAFNGTSYDSSSYRGTSTPVTVTLGGGIIPPAALEGLIVVCVPEPSTTLLALFGIAALAWNLRTFKQPKSNRGWSLTL